MAKADGRNRSGRGWRMRKTVGKWGSGSCVCMCVCMLGRWDKMRNVFELIFRWRSRGGWSREAEEAKRGKRGVYSSR